MGATLSAFIPSYTKPPITSNFSVWSSLVKPLRIALLIPQLHTAAWILLVPVTQSVTQFCKYADDNRNLRLASMRARAWHRGMPLPLSLHCKVMMMAIVRKRTALVWARFPHTLQSGRVCRLSILIFGIANV